jgi:oxygen-independent coproporphyrinogen III oxidase
VSGLYIHIPFCKKACSYCDFHFSTNLQNKAQLVDTICEEIALKKNYLPADVELKSVYFGGGTPSLLSEKELGQILSATQKSFRISSNAEITLEANPDDIDSNTLQSWKRAGINRLSIGLQSFNNAELKWMNRTHNAEASEACIQLAQDAGFSNISIDLIYGSKFQNMEMWHETLEKALALNTQHISAYNLTIEAKTALGNQFSRGLEPPVSDELSSKQFLLMLEILGQNEFIQYEISNFAKANYFAVHNSNYWLGQSYAGVGPSAHSYDGLRRRWNIKNNWQYIQKVQAGEIFYEEELLSEKDKFNEYILTRLRTIWGCDIKEMAKLFGSQRVAYFEEKIKQQQQFVVEQNGIFTLNALGKLQADGISATLFI